MERPHFFFSSKEQATFSLRAIGTTELMPALFPLNNGSLVPNLQPTKRSSFCVPNFLCSMSVIPVHMSHMSPGSTLNLFCSSSLVCNQVQILCEIEIEREGER